MARGQFAYRHPQTHPADMIVDSDGKTVAEKFTGIEVELTAEQQARINKDNDLQSQIDNIDIDVEINEETIKEIVHDNSLRGLKAGDTPVYPTTTFILDETGHPVISEDGKGDYMIVMGGDERPYLRATNSMFDITTGTEYMLVVDNGQINLKEVI